MGADQVIADMYIDRDAPVPLHYQIQICLENCLRSGQLHPGDKLPNIADMSRMLNVSHVTALKAVTELQKKGLVVSRRGVGTIVAPKRAGLTDVIIPTYDEGQPSVDSEYWDFHNQIKSGLIEGFQEPDRSISLMYTGGMACSPSEFLASLHARRVDSVIAYRPTPDFHPLLAAIGREIPTVSLFNNMPGAPVHCVTANVENAIQSMIARRLANGSRQFAYIALEWEDLNSSDPESINPYRTIYLTLKEMLNGAGATLTEHTLTNEDINSYELSGKKVDILTSDGRTLQPGSVVILQFPSLLRYTSNLPENLDIISYTEFYRSFEDDRDLMSLIYFGVDEAARKACNLIKEEALPGVGQRGRIMRCEPETHDLLDASSD